MGEMDGLNDNKTGLSLSILKKTKRLMDSRESFSAAATTAA